jgi:hypothetical protein
MSKVFLLNVDIIVFPVRSTAGKLKILSLAISIELIIDELTIVVRVYSWPGERCPPADSLEEFKGPRLRS